MFQHSMRRVSGRVAAVSLMALVVVSSTAWRGPAAPVPTKGVTFKIVMKLRTPSRNARTPVPPILLHGTGLFANGRGRIDIDSSSGGPVSYSKGDYFVIDSGKTLLVRPSVQTYSEVESPIQNPLETMVGQLNNVQIAVSGVNVKMDKLGTTDSVAHMTTQHFQIQTDYTLDLGTRQLKSEITTDLWVAKLPFRFVNPVDQTMSDARLPAAFRPIYDKIAGYSAQIANEGTSVKTVTTNTFSVSGMSFETLRSAEIMDLREADVDEGIFRIPDRFRKGGS